MVYYKKFKRSELERHLEEIGNNLENNVKVYLIGGCSMIIRRLKIATKDIDAVFVSSKELRLFVNALKKLKFKEVVKLGQAYQKLGASAVLRNKDSFQFDVFLKQVCRALEVTETMLKRAEFYKRFGNLDVYLMSSEDVFLFKSITDRETDLADMETIAKAGINWNIIKKECLSQKKRRIWEAFLVQRLEKLKERGISAPIIKDLWKSAGDELVKIAILEIIKSRNNSFGEIAKIMKEKYKYSKSWTRKELEKLVKKKIIIKQRNGKKYIYYSCQNE